MASKIYDEKTRDWFYAHPGKETTVLKCDRCGLYYRPTIGHKCKTKEVKKGE